MSVSHPRYLNLRGSLPSVTPQQMRTTLYGQPLPVSEILALCAANGITDARVEGGRVVAPCWRSVTVLDTARSVVVLAQHRAERASRNA